MSKFTNMMEKATQTDAHYAYKLEAMCLESKKHIIKLLGGLTISREIKIEVPINMSIVIDFLHALPYNPDADKFTKLMHYVTLDMVKDNSLLSVGYIELKNLWESCPQIANQVKIGKVINTLYGSGYADKWSRIVQVSQTKGIATISVDPCDILTMSQVGTNWSSCYSWAGCYQRGLLAYLTDVHTAVAYIHSGKNFEFDFGEMPKKEWRQLIHFDVKNMSAICSREYPIENKNYAENVRSIIGECFAKLYGIPNNRRTKTSEILSMFDSVNDFFYCDAKRQGYELKAMKMDNGEYPERLSVHDEDDTYCVGCGKYNSWDGSSLLCEYCSSQYVCIDCGLSFHDNDDAIRHNGDEYCPCCWRRSFQSCERCSEIIPTEDAIFVGDDAHCSTCIDEYFSYCNNCETYVRDCDTESINHYTYCKDCVSEIFNICFECYTQINKDESYSVDGKILCTNCLEEIGGSEHVKYCRLFED